MPDLMKPEVNSPKSILTPILDLEVLGPYVPNHLHVRQHAPGPYRCDLTVDSVILVPALTTSGPDEGLHDFVCIRVELVNDFRLHVDELDVFFCDLSDPTGHILG